MALTTPHVFTLTGNLLAERTLEVPAWSPGGTFRAQRESFQVGGKGINVSKMLTRLGVANTALCFPGGAAGAECEQWLREHGFAVQAFATGSPTRQGTVVRAPGVAETTFLGRDVAPNGDAIAACATFLDRQPAGQVLAFCGSFPGWAEGETAPLRAALERWVARGNSLVADTYGPPLAWMAAQPLALLKINASELRTLSPTGDTAQIRAQRCVITDGPRPVIFRDVNGDAGSVTPPPIREVSATGSGDVLLACLVHALFHAGKSLRDAVTYALPYAAANAAHQGIAEFPYPP